MRKSGLADIAVAAAVPWVRTGSELVSGENVWAEAARELMRGDFARAAEVYAAIGTQPDEADARLRSARAFVAAGRQTEASEQLGKTLAFYRSVGATRYLREGQALLVRTA